MRAWLRATHSARSFFDYLGKEYGDDAVIRMSKRAQAGHSSDYARLLGKTFAELEQEWRAWLVDTYADVDDAEAAAQRYRRETPIQFIQICEAGKHI